MNKLIQLETFQAVLESYEISDYGKKILASTQLMLLVAPSSSGRNTIIKELMKTGHYHYIVSDTTRRKRINDGILEQDGVEYWFRTEEEVLHDLQAGNFLEAAIIHNQQVSGISIRELERARDESRVAVTDIEIIGVERIVAAKPDTKTLFVLPPNFDEWMRRLDGRGDMTIGEKRRRLESALEEFDHALAHNYYHFILNDSLENAMRQIEVVTSGKGEPMNTMHAKQVTEELLVNTKEWLKSQST